jgi:hypothetical protein
MNITIDWQLPLQLTQHKKIILDPKDISDLIEARPGVYFFSRKFGSHFVPFYSGETLIDSGAAQGSFEECQNR